MRSGVPLRAATRRGCTTAAALLLSLSCGKKNDSASPSELSRAARPEPEPFETPACAATATTDCVDDPTSALCPGAAGYAFLQPVVSTFSEGSASLSVPAPGTVCMSGVVPAPVPNEHSEADLIFLLSPRDNTQTCILAPFDAQGLDIQALQFDLDRVPADGWFGLGVRVVQQAQCDGDPFECTNGGFYDWLTPDRQEVVPLRPGPNLAPLDEFVGDDLADPMDAHWISDFVLVLVGSGPLSLEFCVSNIKFLDSTGQEVIPPPLP